MLSSWHYDVHSNLDYRDSQMRGFPPCVSVTPASPPGLAEMSGMKSSPPWLLTWPPQFISIFCIYLFCIPHASPNPVLITLYFYALPTTIFTVLRFTNMGWIIEERSRKEKTLNLHHLFKCVPTFPFWSESLCRWGWSVHPAVKIGRDKKGAQLDRGWNPITWVKLYSTIHGC